jgi:hypothetical protein
MKLEEASFGPMFCDALSQSSLPPHSLLSYPASSLEEATNDVGRQAIRYMESIEKVLNDYNYVGPEGQKKMNNRLW